MNIILKLLLKCYFRFSYGAGHYTQVVWADTEELGCGMVYYNVRDMKLKINAHQQSCIK